MHAVFRDWMYARKARRQWQIQENLIWRVGGVQSLVQKGLLNFFVTSWESRDDHLFLDVWTPVAVGAGPYCFANRGEQIIGGYTNRRGPRPVSNVLRKSVRFFIINIFLIKKNFPGWNLENGLDKCFIRGELNWPISHLNDSETQERGLEGVKIQKISWGSMTPYPARSFGPCLGNR